jgi:hypothetical protein
MKDMDRLIHLALVLLTPFCAPGCAPSAAPAVAAPPPELRVSWLPEQPVAGTMVEIVARPVLAADSVARLTASVAGERLHFEWTDGAWRAIAGIPIETSGTLSFTIVASRDGIADSSVVELPVSSGEYAMERLRVAPRFTQPPDSALAARMAREREKALAVSRRAHDTPRMWREPFLRPRDTRITSGFGHGREFNGTVQSRHMGVDFAGAVGTPVAATNRGVVALVDDFHLAGRVVYLDHGAGLVTAYFHLSEALVAAGDTVERGQTIGRVGATGRVTGPHLHWIARYGSITVNPLTLLDVTPRPPAEGQ